MKYHQLLWVYVLIMLLSSCSKPQDDVLKHRVLAFGTQVDITIRHHDRKQIRRAFKRLENDFQVLHKAMHPWQPGPMLRTNRLLQTGSWFSVPASLYPLIQQSRDLAIKSSHHFNPAIGALINAWGFHREDYNQLFTPDMTMLNRLQQDIPDIHDMETKGIRLRGTHPDIQLDFSGIAKGYAIDRAIETLRAFGIRHAIINAGGDLRSIGSHPDRVWSIGIQHPRSTDILAEIIPEEDESIFTSGDYQRFYFHKKQRYHHIIDPFNGKPVTHTAAVTVIHHNATEADAAATALLVAGPANWHKIAEQLSIRYVLLMTADGQIHMNPGMHQRIRLHNIDPDRITISQPLKTSPPTL